MSFWDEAEERSAAWNRKMEMTNRPKSAGDFPFIHETQEGVIVLPEGYYHGYIWRVSQSHRFGMAVVNEGEFVNPFNYTSQGWKVTAACDDNPHTATVVLQGQALCATGEYDAQGIPVQQICSSKAQLIGMGPEHVNFDATKAGPILSKIPLGTPWRRTRGEKRDVSQERYDPARPALSSSQGHDRLDPARNVNSASGQPHSVVPVSHNTDTNSGGKSKGKGKGKGKGGKSKGKSKGKPNAGMKYDAAALGDLSQGTKSNFPNAKYEIQGTESNHEAQEERAYVPANHRLSWREIRDIQQECQEINEALAQGVAVDRARFEEVQAASIRIQEQREFEEALTASHQQKQQDDRRRGMMENHNYYNSQGQYIGPEIGQAPASSSISGPAGHAHNPDANIDYSALPPVPGSSSASLRSVTDSQDFSNYPPPPPLGTPMVQRSQDVTRHFQQGNPPVFNMAKDDTPDKLPTVFEDTTQSWEFPSVNDGLVSAETTNYVNTTAHLQVQGPPSHLSKASGHPTSDQNLQRQDASQRAQRDFLQTAAFAELPAHIQQVITENTITDEQRGTHGQGESNLTLEEIRAARAAERQAQEQQQANWQRGRTDARADLFNQVGRDTNGQSTHGYATGGSYDTSSNNNNNNANFPQGAAYGPHSSNVHGNAHGNVNNLPTGNRSNAHGLTPGAAHGLTSGNAHGASHGNAHGNVAAPGTQQPDPSSLNPSSRWGGMNMPHNPRVNPKTHMSVPQNSQYAHQSSMNMHQRAFGNGLENLPYHGQNHGGFNNPNVQAYNAPRINDPGNPDWSNAGQPYHGQDPRDPVVLERMIRERIDAAAAQSYNRMASAQQQLAVGTKTAPPRCELYKVKDTATLPMLLKAHLLSLFRHIGLALGNQSLALWLET